MNLIEFPLYVDHEHVVEITHHQGNYILVVEYDETLSPVRRMAFAPSEKGIRGAKRLFWEWAHGTA